MNNDHINNEQPKKLNDVNDQPLNANSVNHSPKQLTDVKISVLDLAPIVEGGTAADSFHNTLNLAQNAERWGYHRFWLAEHHNMPGIASSATSVVIGYVAAGTKSIRVGAGGIMLPNHAPLLIAEQFGTLESMYPGRIDLGLGRAPGSDQPAARAVRRGLTSSGQDFPALLHELRGYFAPSTESAEADDPSVDQTATAEASHPSASARPAKSGNPFAGAIYAESPPPRVRAIPGEGLNIPIWLLGSSGFSAQLASQLGLPFAFASHFAPDYLLPALELYRKNFRPSNVLQQPYAMVGLNVIVAETDEEAAKLATSQQMQFVNLIRRLPGKLQPPVDNMDEIWNIHEEAIVRQQMAYSIAGNRETVRKRLQSILEETQADEFIVSTHVYDHQARLRSYELLADIVGLRPE